MQVKRHNRLAPIIIFTYRRVPEKLIQSLLKNKLSKDSDVIIFSDGSKGNNDYNDVKKVRQYLHTIQGFKDITIIASSRNKGLANSIISGVSDILSKYDKVIVLEDDLIVSENFLEYMNQALSFYEKDNNIWSISGYSPNLPCINEIPSDIYLAPRASSWGWATWKDRWESIDWNITDWHTFKKDKKAINEFNLGGNDMSKMLELQMLGKIDSWAIRWCYNQYKYKKYTVYPKKSKVINDGFNDTKGTHNTSDLYSKWRVSLNNENVNFCSLNINENILQCFKKYYNIPFSTKIGYFFKKNGGYKTVKKVYNYLVKLKENNE